MHFLPVAWVKRGWDWFRPWVKVHETLAELQKQIDQQKQQLETLSAEVAALQRKRGLTPHDVEPLDGIPWGFVGDQPGAAPLLSFLCRERPMESGAEKPRRGEAHLPLPYLQDEPLVDPWLAGVDGWE